MVWIEEVVVVGVEVVVIGGEKGGVDGEEGRLGEGEKRLGGRPMGWRLRADEEGESEVREGGVGRASATICAGCSGRCRSLWRQLAAAVLL